MSINSYKIKKLNIITNAYWYNTHLDSKLSLSERAMKSIAAHLRDRREYPTLGTLVHQKYYTQQEPKAYASKLSQLREHLTFRNWEKGIKESIKTLYPNTKNVRRILLKEKRVVLDEVKPIERNLKHSIIKLFGKIL